MSSRCLSRVPYASTLEEDLRQLTKFDGTEPLELRLKAFRRRTTTYRETIQIMRDMQDTAIRHINFFRSPVQRHKNDIAIRSAALVDYMLKLKKLWLHNVSGVPIADEAAISKAKDEVAATDRFRANLTNFCFRLEDFLGKYGHWKANLENFVEDVIDLKEDVYTLKTQFSDDEHEIVGQAINDVTKFEEECQVLLDICKIFLPDIVNFIEDVKRFLMIRRRFESTLGTLMDYIADLSPKK